MATATNDNPVMTRVTDLAKRCGISTDTLMRRYAYLFSITTPGQGVRSMKMVPTEQAEEFLAGLREGGFDRAVLRMEAMKAEKEKAAAKPRKGGK